MPLIDLSGGSPEVIKTFGRQNTIANRYGSPSVAAQDFDGQRSMRSYGSALSISFRLPHTNKEFSQVGSNSKLLKKGRTVEDPDISAEQNIVNPPLSKVSSFMSKN